MEKLKFEQLQSTPLGVQFFPSMIPLTRWSGLICCRKAEMLAYAMNAASSAFLPSHGAAPACALNRVRKE